MLILGIETSGLRGSVALAENEQLLAERHLNQEGRRHAQSLVLEIREMLRDCDTTARDVELIAVSRGPGSFTGLRVGMTCAKTFAYATRCRFLSIDTFAAIAENLPSEIHRVTIIEDAQRDELFVGEYCRVDSGGWSQIAPMEIMTVPNFLQKRSSIDIVIGPGVKKLQPVESPAKIIFDPEICQPRAAAVVKIASRQALSGQSLASEDDFWKALPYYVRLSAAEEKQISTNAAK